MVKRVFVTPFWWMLVMGIIGCCISMGILGYLARNGSPIKGLAKLSFFYLPVIMFVEGVMYWTIRRRITHRKDAWNHLLLFTGAYAVNFGVRAAMLAILILDPSAVPGAVFYMRMIGYGQLYFFWGLVLLAHFFFARVLVKAFAKPPVAEEGGEGHLLDDVLD